MKNLEKQINRINDVNDYFMKFKDDVKNLGDFDDKVLYSMMVCGSYLSNLLVDNLKNVSFERIETLVDELVKNNIVSKYLKDLLFISKNTDHLKLIFESIDNSNLSTYDLIMSMRTEMCIYVDELTPINGFNDSWVAFRNVLDKSDMDKSDIDKSSITINASRYLFNMFDLYLRNNDSHYFYETRSFSKTNIYEDNINQMVIAYIRADFLNKLNLKDDEMHFDLNVLTENPYKDKKEYDICVIGDYKTGYDKHIGLFENKDTDYIKAPHEVLKQVKNNTIYTSLKLCVNSLNIIKSTGSIALAVEKKAAIALKGNDLVRDLLIKNNCLESVITLPDNNEDFYDNSALLFILSKRDNQGVLMLAGENKDEMVANEVITTTISLSEFERVNLYEKDNHDDIFNIRSLVSYFLDGYTGEVYEQCKAYYMIRVKYKQLLENDFNCIPEYYLAPYSSYGRKTEYLNFIKAIFKRGYTPSDIDARIQQAQLYPSPSNFRYLSVSNISDGQIKVDTLMSISRLEDKELKTWVLKDGDIVISKNGNPYHVAVAENLGDCKVLVNNNLFIIRCKENWDPYYIKMYLESDEGHMQIQRLLPVTGKYELSMSLLGELRIPFLPFEVQRKLAKDYKKYLTLIDEFKLKLNILSNKDLQKEVVDFNHHND